MAGDVRIFRATRLWGAIGRRCTNISSNKVVKDTICWRYTNISSNGVAKGQEWSEMYDIFE
ncbi:hypothetical protein [Cohnella abietis]|uniref:Uncharacterized protein n=1 Tax=Cohnella abietis TaxID=2507935 RepID=A0A3T1D0T3_9BACL|nr:hypothetical protein [Cohnella abietis]BBI31710.1 hypothetical protein KCTCHS21_11090 [Cohnella abietis]